MVQTSRDQLEQTLRSLTEPSKDMLEIRVGEDALLLLSPDRKKIWYGNRFLRSGANDVLPILERVFPQATVSDYYQLKRNDIVKSTVMGVLTEPFINLDALRKRMAVEFPIPVHVQGDSLFARTSLSVSSTHEPPAPKRGAGS